MEAWITSAVYHLGLFVFFPRVFLSSRVTGACPVTTDLIMRVYVRTTATTYFEGVSYLLVSSQQCWIISNWYLVLADDAHTLRTEWPAACQWKINSWGNNAHLFDRNINCILLKPTSFLLLLVAVVVVVVILSTFKVCLESWNALFRRILRKWIEWKKSVKQNNVFGCALNYLL